MIVVHRRDPHTAAGSAWSPGGLAAGAQCLKSGLYPVGWGRDGTGLLRESRSAMLSTTG